MQMIFNGLEQGVKLEEKGKRGRFDLGDRLRRIPVVSARECNTASYEALRQEHKLKHRCNCYDSKLI
jgi:hypothetical protein